MNTDGGQKRQRIQDWFPHDLIQKCLTCRSNEDGNSDNDDDDEAESLLQVVLSVLAQHSLHSLQEQQQFHDWLLLQRKTGSNTDHDNNGNSRPTSLPRCMFQFLQKQQQQQDTSVSLSSTSPQNASMSTTTDGWCLGWTLMASLLQTTTRNKTKNNGKTKATRLLLTPFQIHSVASQFLLQHHAPSTAISTGAAMLATTGLVLCAVALERCSQRGDDTAGLCPPRWKRQHSLLAETLHLFQRTFLWNDQQQLEDERNNQARGKIMSTNRTTLMIVPLWLEVLHPTCQTLWYTLPRENNVVVEGSQFWTAAAVAITSRLLAVAIPELCVQPAQHLQQQPILLDAFYQVLLTTVTDNLDLVWCQPWRQAVHQYQTNNWPTGSFPSSQSPKHGSSTMQRNDMQRLTWWTLERQEQQQSHHESDDESDSNDDDPHAAAFRRQCELYNPVDTEWDDLGLALLASYAWNYRSPERTRIPLVWHPLYLWRLFLPHVAILLNTDHHPTSDGSNAGDSIGLALFQRGLELLQALMAVLPIQSLLVPTTNLQLYEVPKDDHGIIHATTTVQPQPAPTNRPPDHPVGIFQLLLNGMMTSASRAHAFSQSSSPMNVPSELVPRQWFQCCQQLLSKYTPHGQLDLIIRQLLPRCPSESLRSKLVDLLRPLWNCHAVVKTVLWHELVAMVAPLGRHLIVVAGDNNFTLVQNPTDLIDQVEYFVSLCTMLQLGWKLRQLTMAHSERGDETPQWTRPRDIVLRTRNDDEDNDDEAGGIKHTAVLPQFHEALMKYLELCESNTAVTPPDEWYRLKLLECVLRQLLEL